MTKKRILLVATGGTIASKEEGNGLSPALSGEELTRYVPEVADLAALDVKQAMNIDSTNMRPSDWLRVARTIMESYDDYDGFVVLHGTDTMAYTAAALSYLIQHSPKPMCSPGRSAPWRAPSPTRSSTCTKACCTQPTTTRATCRSRSVASSSREPAHASSAP